MKGLSVLRLPRGRPWRADMAVIFVLLTPTGAMLVARGGSQSGQTAFAAAFLIWE